MTPTGVGTDPLAEPGARRGLTVIVVVSVHVLRPFAADAGGDVAVRFVGRQEAAKQLR